MRVATVVGTRPEIIRLSRVIVSLDQSCDHELIHTGQHYDYELNQVFFDDLGLRKPDHFLHAAGGSPAETIGNIITRTDTLLSQLKPDAFVILGDTNSALAAYAAKRRKVPVFHMEAGNRCFDDRVPEELNRRIVDHLADINLPYSDIAREYLLREGFAPDRIIKTGSPMFEVLHHYRPRIDASDVLSRLRLEAGTYFLVSSHREENVDSPPRLARLVAILNGLARDYDARVIVSTHPRTRKRFARDDVKLDKRVDLLAPLAFSDYVHLQMHARTVLSDSGSITEESSILGFPALNLRDTHERPEGMEEAAVMLTGVSYVRVRDGLTALSAQGQSADRARRIVKDYAVPNVSEKVARIILSYTDYVNRAVWHRPHIDTHT